MRCILCKGSYYPPTTPRPIITEVSLSAPLCEPESEKTEKECKLWEIGNNPLNETEAMLTLIAVSNSSYSFLLYFWLKNEYIEFCNYLC